VFDGNSNGLKYPIIHRVVKVWEENGEHYLSTKGDNNDDISNKERKISDDELLGKAVIRLPLLGWVKIKFSEFIYKLVEVF
jgi:hypothetical protein